MESFSNILSSLDGGSSSPPSFQENPPSFLQAAPRVLADSGSLDLLFDLHCNTESVWCCVFGIHGKFVRPIRAAGAEKIGTFDQNPAGFSVELCTLLERTLLDPAPRRLAEKIRTLIQPRSARALTGVQHLLCAVSESILANRFRSSILGCF